MKNLQENPKISIIMATYNRAHFIVESIRSIQNQIFQDWECLIIDDGGTDNTENVISPILNSDARFKFFKRDNSYKKGLPGCRNYGLDLAKGDYIIFFDDDDIIHPQNLSISLDSLVASKTNFCHYSKSSFVDNPPKFDNQMVSGINTITINDIEDIVTQKIGFASCTVLWKKECFNGNRFNESLLYAEEWECYIRLLTNGFNGIMIDNVLYYNRKHPHSNTGEFYLNNPIRRKSYSEAILLVVKKLKAKKLLTNSLQRYFIALSINFTEYNLFKSILNTAEFGTFEKIKWQLFYLILPLRLKLYKIRKAKNK